MKKIAAVFFTALLFYSCSGKKPEPSYIFKNGYAKRLGASLSLKLYGIGVNQTPELANNQARRLLTLQKKGFQFITSASSFASYSFPGISALGSSFVQVNKRDIKGNYVNILKIKARYIAKRKLLYAEIDRRVYLKMLCDKPEEVMEFIIKSHFKPITDKGYRIAGVCFITGFPGLFSLRKIPSVINTRFTIIFRRA